MHLVVLYGSHEADWDMAQLELTNQLLDAVLGELAMIARGQLVLIVGDFNVEPCLGWCYLGAFMLLLLWLNALLTRRGGFSRIWR